MASKKSKDQDSSELTQLVTSTFLRSTKLLSLSVRAGTDAALLSVKTFLDSSRKTELSKQFLIDQARRLTTELGKLKGSLQKAGQLFSIYGEHFLPDEVNTILKSLQKDTPPVSWEVMKTAAKRTLGEERLKRLSIDPKPVGTASIGQVYKVRVEGQEGEWCLKLQYPGVDKSIDSDLKVLRRLFDVLKFIPKDMNLDGLFAEIRAMLHREVDYLKEADSTEHFRNWLAGDPRYIVPLVNREFTTKRAILTSFQTGYDVDGPEVAALSQERRNHLGEAMLDLFFQEFFTLRSVQTDPHFGNYRIRINQDGADQWVLLDFGAVRSFPQSFVREYKAIAQAVVFNDDPQGMYRALRALGFMTHEDTDSDIRVFYEISRLVSEPFMKAEPYAWGKTQLAQRVAEKIKSVIFGIGIRRIPEELIFLDRKIGGVFTILQKLDAEFSGRKILEKYLL